MGNFTRAYNSIKSNIDNTITKRLSSGTETLVLDYKAMKATNDSIPDIISDESSDDNLRRILRGMPTKAELSRASARSIPRKSFEESLKEAPSEAMVSRRMATDINSSDAYKAHDRYLNDLKNGPTVEYPLDIPQISNDITWAKLKQNIPSVKEVEKRISKSPSLYQQTQGFFGKI